MKQLPLKERRRVARWYARREASRRKAAKRWSCDPRRLWPRGYDCREDYEAFKSGDFNRILKRMFRAERVADLVYRDSPFFALIKKV